MRPYDRSRVTHFAHRAGGYKRPVAMKVTSPNLPSLFEKNDSLTDQKLMKRLKEAAEIIAEACRLIAGRFSTRIPGSLEVKSDAKHVYILGGGPPAPNAYPFDPPRNPPVRHPVYATGPRSTWHWAPQPYRPFLEEGAEAGGDRAAEIFAQIIDDWAEEIGTSRP